MNFPIVYHGKYVTALPPEHRFPMPKFGHIFQQLLAEGLIHPGQVHTPKIATRKWLALAHTPPYIADFCSGLLNAKAMRRIGLPWSPDLVKRTRMAVGGTVLTAQLALQYGLACNTAGGTHHAYADFGSGFCIFNDLVIAARLVQQSGLAQKILVVDLDVHQGDGTAAILAGDASIFTFSMHCEKNFPFRKQQSDLDVPLAVGMGDKEYLSILADYLPGLLSHFRPDLVLYDAGVDVHAADRLGKLALTNQGIYDRDTFVLNNCLSRAIPVATVVGGGYDRDMAALAQRHSLLFRAASALLETFEANLTEVNKNG